MSDKCFEIVGMSPPSLLVRSAVTAAYGSPGVRIIKRILVLATVVNTVLPVVSFYYW